jgi:hypothetical protein
MGKWTSNELKKGIKIEMEHSETIKKHLPDWNISEKDKQIWVVLMARDIALDHLKEDRNYYRKLKKVGL